MMEEYFTTTTTTAIAIILTAICTYAVLITFTRIAGKRSFSKMSSFDFAMTVAVGSLLATTILSSSVSLLEGVIGLAIVYLLQISAAMLRRFKWFKELIDNTPLLLMDGTEILYENLKKARVAEGDLRSKLREANVIELKEVRAVVFETTGDISVLHTDKVDDKLNDWLLKDVKR
ncbi:putative membrane protein [Owenweeksia hongkongensis DSM 17368]|uniref:Putative membrane protein n=2 Tax=Owenweeksia TaxID=267986 RepID=G8R4M2_OWEHD|nr:putative membrane protein [Owenweeksia hongkongensis DSM 17368]